MTTQEMNADNEGTKRSNMLPCTGEECPLAPLDFLKLTPSQFGISVQSFTPASLNHEEKSRLAQIKSRRRSSVGVRGSPETNSLIRFMARQKMKTVSRRQTPELVKGSPGFPSVASTLSQKMASFQRLMDMEESEVCEPMPKQDNTRAGIKTRNNLSEEDLDGGKENHFPMGTPTPSKRRRVAPPGYCKVEITEANAPVLDLSLKEQKLHTLTKHLRDWFKQFNQQPLPFSEDQEIVTQAVAKGPLPSCQLVEAAEAVLGSPSLCLDFEPLVTPVLQASSPTKNQQRGIFEIKTSGLAWPNNLAAASPAEPSSPIHIKSLSSQQEMKPKGDNDSSETPAVKKKQVHFGGLLSPEVFDKNLPPSTPLQKGGTPARATTPGGSLQLRSVLKTPHRSEASTPESLRNFCFSSEFGASPTFAIPRSCKLQSQEEDIQTNVPSLELKEPAVTNDEDCMWDAQMNLNGALREELPLQKQKDISSESVTEQNTAAETDTVDSIFSLPKKEEQLQTGIETPAAARSNNRKKKLQQEWEPTTDAPSFIKSRKRKVTHQYELPEESEPVKRSTRSAAKLASGKIKKSSTRHRWNKEVNHALYGSREYASKNPTLSPINESLSFISQSPAIEQTPVNCTALNQKSCLTQEIQESVRNVPMLEAAKDTLDDTHETRNISISNTSISFSNSKSDKGKARRLSGRGLRRKRPQRRVNVSEDDLLGREALDLIGEIKDDNHKGKNSAVLEEIEPLCTVAVNEQQDALKAEKSCMDSNEKSERLAGFDELTTVSTALGKELNILCVQAETAKRKTKGAPKIPRGRKSSVNQEDIHLISQAAESRKEDEAARQHETNDSSSDGNREGREATLDLAPWQADFDFENVFKPVVARGQRSVRRSLRNQSNADNITGLAWMTWTSPFSDRKDRRSTRRQGIYCPPNPTLAQ